MVDDHMCLMGWDMMEMGMKWNLMMRMKIHVQCLHNPTHTSSVFYSSITKI